MKVRDVMTKNPITISPDDTVSDALDIIEKFHIWSIPVVYKEKILGIVTKQDIDSKSESHEQKVSDIMSKTPVTISPDEDLAVAVDTIKRAEINAIIVAEGTKIVGIVTRYDVYKKSLLNKTGMCHYCRPRGDSEKKGIFQCKYCKEWFCGEHTEPRKPMLAPFKSTDIEEHMEWEKEGGHPCIPYFNYLIKKEKEEEERTIAFIHQSKKTYVKITESKIKYEPEPEIKSESTDRINLERKNTSDEVSEKEIPKKIDNKGLVLKITGVVLVIVLLFSLWLLYNQTNETINQNSKLSAISTNIEDVKNQLNSVKGEISSTEANLQTVRSKIQLLSSGDKYDLHNPTYSEVISFLAKDETNTNTYSLSSYTCTYFSKDVNNNAESQGIRCAYVELSFPGIGHAIVAFETTDKGLVYFEPQHDVRANIEIGKKFYSCLAQLPGYLPWEAPGYDDTIEDIIQFW
jgi:DNA-binding protein H-NS